MTGHFDHGMWKEEPLTPPKGTEFMNIILSAEEVPEETHTLVGSIPAHLSITIAVYPRVGFKFEEGTAIHRYAKTLLAAMKAAAEARSDNERVANRTEIRDMIRKISEQNRAKSLGEITKPGTD